MKKPPTALLLGSLLTSGLFAQSTITLDTLADSVMVGLTDGDPAVEPLAPGDGWFTATYAGTARQRNGNDNQFRTQWYFRFDLTPLAGLIPTEIIDAKLSIPQIGRLNTIISTTPLKVFDPNDNWDTSGTNWPIWNFGREPGFNTGPGPGGTLLRDFGSTSYQLHGTSTDKTDANIEGYFEINNTALTETVTSWVADPADNEGFLVALTGASYIGLAFGTPTLEITYSPDTDGDGMPDSYEDATPGLDKNTPEDADEGADPGSFDGDALTNLEEYNFGTDPNVADVDGDDLNDGGEFAAGTNPFVPDTDSDGLNDGEEVNGTLNPYEVGYVPGTTPAGIPGEGTDPLVGDSDGDTISDFDELDSANGSITNPNSNDTDGDGLFDDEEIDNGLDPTDATGDNGAGGDPDMDNLSNNDEIVTHGTNPIMADTDGDGLDDDEEINGDLNPWMLGTNTGSFPGEETDPLNPDSDNDGLNDFAEVNAGNGSVTDPNNQDTDNDTLLDGFEVDGQLDPLDDGTVDESGSGMRDGPNGDFGDPDGDTLTNAEEQTAGTDPNDTDTDDDTLDDFEELNTHFTDPTLQDTDHDLIRDDEELVEGADGFVTLPTNGDTDGDTFKDFIEIEAGSDPELPAVTPSFPAINWTVEEFDEETDLSTAGTLLFADNLQGADMMANGIPFTGRVTSGTDRSSPQLQTLTDSSAPPTNVPGYYDNEIPALAPLFSTFWFQSGTVSTNYAITGLTPGKTYLVQIGRVDDRGGSIVNRYMVADGFGGGNELDPIGPTNSTYGGPDNPGILFTGTFTAQYTVQNFIWEQFLDDGTLTGTHLPFIQVREIDAPTPVQVVDVQNTGSAVNVSFSGLNPAKSYQLVRSATLQDSFPTVVDGPRPPAGASDTFSDTSILLPAEGFYQLEEMP